MIYNININFKLYVKKRITQHDIYIYIYIYILYCILLYI